MILIKFRLNDCINYIIPERQHNTNEAYKKKKKKQSKLQQPIY